MEGRGRNSNKHAFTKLYLTLKALVNTTQDNAFTFKP